VDLRVKDNQFVKEGDLLFVIDPRPYELAVARAKAGLSLTRKEVAVFQKALKVADAAITRAEAQRLAAAAMMFETSMAVNRAVPPGSGTAGMSRCGVTRRWWLTTSRPNACSIMSRTDGNPQFQSSSGLSTGCDAGRRSSFMATALRSGP